MNIKEKAQLFAIKAHKGQVRKSEIDKPMLIHVMSVGNLLEKYGCDDNVIAAGYLHDIIEDTDYTIEEIKREFGTDIANLVLGASELNKSLSWEIRKQKAVEKTKLLSFRNKLIIAADKVNNLEDLIIKFKKEGVEDFSLFNSGKEHQKWYYENIYKSLVFQESKDEPLFIRLKEVIEIVFKNKENEFLKEKVFNDNLDYYEKLKCLHAQKMELQRLKVLSKLNKPFVIEFSGTPRTGKTTILNNLQDFFRKGEFKVKLLEELTTSTYYKKVLLPQLKGLSSPNINMAIINEITKQLEEEVLKDNDIILVDRSLNDRIIWNFREYKWGRMIKKQYEGMFNKYSSLSKGLIDMLVLTYADPLISLKRDYFNSLALEKRRFLNLENIEEYNNALKSLEPVFKDNVKKVIKVDTSNIDINESSFMIVKEIMPVMKKEYIKTFKSRYK